MARQYRIDPTLTMIKGDPRDLVTVEETTREMNDAQKATRLVAGLEAAIAEAETTGRRARLDNNEANYSAYLGQQDWSAKIPGQSKEFLPKTGIAADKLAAKVRQAIVGGDWLNLSWRERSAEQGMVDAEGILPAIAATKWLRWELENMASDPSHFGILLHDAVKAGSLEASVALKVSDGYVKTPSGPRKGEDSKATWRLNIELVPYAELLRDPTGKDLYLIHRYEMDLYKAKDMAKRGVWDKDAVDKLRVQDLPERDKKPDRQKAEAGADSHKQPGRKQVVIAEFWGTLLDQTTGEALIEDGLFVVGNPGNQNVILAGPMDNPYWHGKRPFGFLELRRVPGGTKHRGHFDDLAKLNFADNELFNLLIDGGIGAVWGINQLRHDYLVDPRQADDGIPQGETLIVNSSLPPGEKVLEQCTSGHIPGEAFNVHMMLQQQMTEAAFSGDMNVASFDTKTSATEIVSRQQQEQGYIGDAIYGLIASSVEPALEMSFILMIQRLTEIGTGELIDCVGLQNAVRLGNLAKTAEGQNVLFDAFAGAMDIKVEGLREIAEQGRLFSRAANLLQLGGIVGGEKGPAVLFQLAGIDMSLFIRDMVKWAGFDPSKYRVQQGLPGQQLALPAPGGAQGQQGGMQMVGAAGQTMPGLPAPGAEMPAMGEHPLAPIAKQAQIELAQR